MGGTFGGNNGSSKHVIPEYFVQEKRSKGSPYYILVSTIYATKNMTREDVVCVINLVWWVILYSNFHVIERTHSSDSPGNLLKMSLLFYCWFPLLISRESKIMAYMVPNMETMMMLQWLIPISPSQNTVERSSIWTRELPMRGRGSGGGP